MRYSMKRAIAFALSLTMMLALPLSASAEGGLITDIYDEDGSVGRIPNADTYLSSGTGSSTDTETNTRPDMDPGAGDKEILTWDGVAPRILDLVLDKESVVVEAGTKDYETLAATLIFEKRADLEKLAKPGQEIEDVEAEIFKWLRWEWVDTSNGGTPNAEKLRILPQKGGKCTLFAVEGGEGTINVWLDNGVAKKADGTANEVWDDDEVGTSVPVTIKEYAASIGYNKEVVDKLTFYVGQKVNLNNFIQRYTDANCKDVLVSGGTEKIEWSVAEANKKDAAVDANGIATLKKVPTNEGHIATFLGVSERGKTVSLELKVEAKNSPNNKPIKKLTAADKKPSFNLDATNAILTVTPDPADSNNSIEWTVKNPSILTVEKKATFDNPFPLAKDVATVKVTPKSVGKTTVTATASSGKKVNFTVTVTNKLTGLKLEGPEKTYVGQSVQLVPVKTPANSPDKIKWTVTGPDKNVKVNKNGVVTIAPKAAKTENVYTITATSANRDSTAKAEFKIKPATAALPYGTNLAKIVKDAKTAKKLTTTLAKSNAKTEDYMELFRGLNTTPIAEGLNATDILAWTSSKTDVASISTEGIARPLAAGSSKLTVTGLVQSNRDSANPKYKVVKATVSLKVTQPVTKLQLKQSKVATTAGKKVTLKVAKYLPKKSTKENVTWSGESVRQNKQNGEVTLSSGSTVATVVATNGARATAEVGVYGKTAQVVIDASAITTEGYAAQIKKGNNSKAVTVEGVSLAGNEETAGFDLVCTAKTSGRSATETNEPVISCTAKGKGAVQIIDKGDNTYRIIPVKAGKVTLTFKSVSGKSGKCTLTITNNLKK